VLNRVLADLGRLSSVSDCRAGCMHLEVACDAADNGETAACSTFPAAIGMQTSTRAARRRDSTLISSVEDIASRHHS
jgi:hypothetical protein